MRQFFYIFSLLFFLLLIAHHSQAQFVNSGQARSSLHWKQINTQDFQIIYPDFFEENAQRIANLYAQLYQHANTLQLKPKKVSIVIQADGGVSNGTVTTAPRKTELYTMPSQNPSDDWLTHLCIHEFRHIVQLDKIDQGITKSISYLFGEIFPIIVTGVYVPMWFMEGDAVCFETSVGHLGRGRSPEFLNQMKAQVVEKGIYPFSKAVLGSNKDFVPNRYTMGYFMTANTRLHYGSDVWSKALDFSGHHPFRLNSFRKSLAITLQEKRDSLWQNVNFRSLFEQPDSVQKSNHVRNAKETLYLDNFAELQKRWKIKAEEITNYFDTIPTNNRSYTNYYHPTPIPHQGVIAYKKGLSETGSFVLLTDRKEQRITRTGTLDDYQFACKHNQLVWSEYFPHLRWEHGGRMRLSSYDLTSGKYRRYSGKNNQYSPFPTENGWGFVETDVQNRAFLVLCDSTLQNEIWRLAGDGNELFIHPSYSQGKILTVVQSPQGLHLEEIDIQTKNRKQLTEKQFYEIDYPVATDSAIIFRASYNGNNAFYQLRDGKITPFLNGRFGVSFPHYQPEEQKIHFSFYTADGYKPASISNSPLSQNDSVVYRTFRLAEQMKKEENWQQPFSTDSIYPSRKYRSFPHLFNIHSWGPIAMDQNEMEVDIAAMIYSQNKLNTLSFYAGYAVKSGYDNGCWLLNATYSRWWPILSLQLESGKDNANNTVLARTVKKDTIVTLLTYNRTQHTEGSLLVQFPFNFSRKHYIRTLNPYLRYKIEAQQNPKAQKAFIVQDINSQLSIAIPVNVNHFHFHQSTQYYHLMEYGLRFNNQTRMTAQELYPRWGQSLSIGYSHILKQSFQLDDQWWYDTRFYFPGFAVNHSIDVYHGFQKMLSKNRNYNNQILYPRGITLPGYEIGSLRCSYHFPIGYPDWSMGTFLYLKNLSGTLFYDFGQSRNKINKENYSSCGMEITTDSHFFQLTFPVQWGFRLGYETQTEKAFAEFLFSIGLSI